MKPAVPVFILPGLQGDSGSEGPVSSCNCSQVQTSNRINTVSVSQTHTQEHGTHTYYCLVNGVDRTAPPGVLWCCHTSCMPLQIFVADGEKQMRRLRAENVMVLRKDRRALYIYTESQWINMLVHTAAHTQQIYT